MNAPCLKASQPGDLAHKTFRKDIHPSKSSSSGGKSRLGCNYFRKLDLAEKPLTFFKSILGTLNHILLDDIIWLKRLARHPSGENALSHLNLVEQPKALNQVLFNELTALKGQRVILDDVIVQWICSLPEADLQGSIIYDNMAGHRLEKPFANFISHLFLHQVHHRGQATTLLSQFGIDFGETDLIEIIP